MVGFPFFHPIRTGIANLLRPSTDQAVECYCRSQALVRQRGIQHRTIVNGSVLDETSEVSMEANRVPLSPISFLNRTADVFPHKAAVLVGDGSRITNSEFRTRTTRLANGLIAMGLNQGDRVAVLAPNDLQLLEAHFGVPGAGCVLVALNTRLSSREYSQILADALPRVLIVDQTLLAGIEDAATTIPSIERMLVVHSESGAGTVDEDYEQWLSSAAASESLRLPKHEDQPIAINYTSGTTGRPKGAVYTHRGAYLNALGQALGMGLDSSSVFLWTLPMFHCNGWCMTWAVTATGGLHVSLRAFDPDRVLKIIERERVTHFCGAPVILNAMATATGGPQQEYSHKVIVATGGAPPSPTVIERMQSLGIHVRHLYGLTETYGPSLICEPQPEWSLLDVDRLAQRISRQGVRTVNVEAARVVDNTGDDVASDGETLGEIVIRSNTVMAGYFGDDIATSDALGDGWFHTGDLAVVHEDGYIEVRDRSKDIIISGGENISSIEVENVILSHPKVSDAAVVATSDEKWGEVPVAFVTLLDGESAQESEIVEWVRSTLAHYKAPKVVVFGPLPKTSTGKTQKHQLRERAAATDRINTQDQE
ncbi:MAG: AMP-binding protein [Acidimicrobiia bacterium]